MGNYIEGFFFFGLERSPSCRELRKSEVKNTLELTVKVVTVPLKFKKAFPWVKPYQFYWINVSTGGKKHVSVFEWQRRCHLQPANAEAHSSELPLSVTSWRSWPHKPPHTIVGANPYNLSLPQPLCGAPGHDNRQLGFMLLAKYGGYWRCKGQRKIYSPFVYVAAALRRRERSLKGKIPTW